ncbi:MAG: aminotransferase class V-fold PLP-dependent enzyme [Clostridia bacterium]|nr:aminotransferase class V-fold PLP-dependent enzyme [Clostridia bacterium]
MNTPICDFVNQYIKNDTTRLHMPGHKGKGPLGFEQMDITEVFGADSLFHASGIIRKSEENASSLFDSFKTYYSTEGSSHLIRSMLLIARGGDKDGYVLAARNAHSSFISACALIDLEVKWLLGKSSYLSCELTPQDLEKALTCVDKMPFCVYVTSPDYLGNTLDIKGLSEVCHRYGVMLLVDNAHGAYLRFLEKSEHPINLGADMCCDSAHKTLPALTGGAYLHISKNAAHLAKDAKDSMALFASSSPSYLTLCSLDKLNSYLAGEYRSDLSGFICKVSKTKEQISSYGYTLVGNERLKITIAAKEYGYLGTELGKILHENNILCEFCDKDFLVLMVTPSNGEGDLDKLACVLGDIPKREPISKAMPAPCLSERKMSIKDAILSDKEEISIDDAEGRTLASLSVACPPAVSVIVAGEIFDKAAIEACRYNEIYTVKVVK